MPGNPRVKPRRSRFVRPAPTQAAAAERALVFTDLVDSTQLAQRLGDVRAAALWAEHDCRARALLALHQGREIDRSDGFFMVFETAIQAARYTLAYHHALADLGVNARIGLHVGPVTLRENSRAEIARGARRFEVEGMAKPLAARVMALAGGGQTLLTAEVRAALKDGLPEGARLQGHGLYRLKGIAEPVEVFELGVRGVAPFLPPPDAAKAYRVVRSGELWQPAREVRHNLGIDRDAFVGRNAELNAIAASFDGPTRLVTLLGPGGIGKTRVARRYGQAWLGEWPGGVYFCDLSEARTSDGIFFAVASALGIALGKDEPAARIGDTIAGRGRCLVVLDNFEQVVAHAAATLGVWLDRAAEAAFLVTSRERLHLSGEVVLAIDPLPLDGDAVALFVVRARAHRADFALGDTNRAAVTEVVRLLDGLPLAIELAAARVRLLSPAQLVDRMRDRFKLLAGGRAATTRQSTLRAAIDWSWDLLPPHEQAALAQCSVFEGGFTLEAAEAVLDLSGQPDASPTMDAIQALVDKSLLRTWVPHDAPRFEVEEPYFGMYVSIHEYAREHLAAAGVPTVRAAEARHGRHFARFGSDDALASLHRHDGGARRRALALELDNLVVASQRAVERGDGASAAGAYRVAWEVLELHGPIALGAELGLQVLELDALDAQLRVAVGVTHGRALRSCGRMAEAAAALDRALALARASGDREGEADALRHRGIVHREQGQMDDALVHYQRALELRREANDAPSQAALLNHIGIVHAEQGRMGEARTHFEQAIAAHRALGDRMAQGVALNNLASVHLEQGRQDEALTCLEAALAIHREVGNRSEESIVLANLGQVHGSQGRGEAARVHFEAALAVAREVGHRRHEAFALGALGDLHRGAGRLDGARTLYEQALSAHRAVGNKRAEGSVLGMLGGILARQGELDRGRQLLDAGDALLADVGDQLMRGMLACIRARIEQAAGNPALARSSLSLAQTLAQALQVEPESDLAREIAALHQALA